MTYVCVFDVNATPLDLSAMDPGFQDLFADASIRDPVPATAPIGHGEVSRIRELPPHPDVLGALRRLASGWRR